MSMITAHASVGLEQAVSEEPRREAPLRDRRSVSPDRPNFGERLGETGPLISAPAFFGPPVIFILGPWLLLVLLLIPPAAFLITLVIVMLLGAGVLFALGTLIASPYLLVRHLRAKRRVHPRGAAPAIAETAHTGSGRPVRRAVGARLIHLRTR